MDRPLGAVKQAYRELTLKLLNLLSERRLSNAETLRSTTKVQLLSQHHQASKVTKFHNGTLIHYCINNPWDIDIGFSRCNASKAAAPFRKRLRSRLGRRGN